MKKLQPSSYLALPGYGVKLDADTYGNGVIVSHPARNCSVIARIFA